MPAPGDQHRGNVANPFEEVKPRISEFTACEIATLQSRLEKQLGPEYISSRSGPSGQKVHYITAEKCIALANDVFGFNGWSSSIQNITVDFVDEHPQTLRVSLGLSVVVRVTLRDGTFHEDIGYGHIENCKGKAAAFEKAKKEGTTDALKRALRNFGNVLGNCIYDKDYLSKVTKIKVAPAKFDENNLHRHSDFVKKEEKQEKEEVKTAVKKEVLTSAEDDLFDDFGDFDDADFCIVEEGHPDEVVIGNSNNTSASDTRGQSGPPAVPKPPNIPSGAPQTPHQGMRAQPTHAVPPRQGVPGQPVPPYRPQGMDQGPNASNTAAARPPQHPTGAQPVAFFSARAVSNEGAESGLNDPVIKPQQLFNPKAESPSIRKTPGFDHNSTKPIPRSALQGQASGPNASGPGTGGPGSRPPSVGPGGAGFQAGRGNVVNPHLDQTRRIGTPGGGGSPLANRGQYRPPTMKRPLADGGGLSGARPALADVPTNIVVGTLGQNQSGLDTKRQRTE